MDRIPGGNQQFCCSYFIPLDLSHKCIFCLYWLAGETVWKYQSKFTASSLMWNFKSTEIHLRYIHFRPSIFRSFFFIFLRICEIQSSLSFLFLKKLQGKSVFLWWTTSWKPITFIRYDTRHFLFKSQSWQVLIYTQIL